MKNLPYFTVLFILHYFLLIQSCSNEDQITNIDSDQYANVLDIQNIPAAPEDWDSYIFSDAGSWVGFALPPDTSQEYYGSFPGPFLHTRGKWLSQGLIQFSLQENSGSVFPSNTNLKTMEIKYLPGYLKQKFTNDDLGLELTLFFADKNHTIIEAKVTNISDEKLELKGIWSGTLFKELAEFKQYINLLNINPYTGNERIILFPYEQFYRWSIQKHSYKLSSKENIVLEPGQNKSFRIVFYFSADGENPSSLLSPVSTFDSVVTKWNEYIQAIQNSNSAYAGDISNQRMAVKSFETLINNWRSPAGKLYHSGLWPSYAVSYFNGFWAWDSWKHAVALAHCAPELAKDQVRAMFDFQNEVGMIADCVYRDSTENNWLNSKPPLAAWAVEEIYKATGDLDFVNEMYDALHSYHYWWYKERDHDRDGLCEYGATADKLVAAKWESGMDNAIRFDNSKLLRNSDSAYSLDQESVDLNSFLYKEKLTLSRLAYTLDRNAEAEKFVNEAEQLKIKINDVFFDEETGFYYDVTIEDHEYITSQGPEGWIPLWTGVATQANADLVVKVMLDTSKFATYIPFPTVARDDPEFSKGYWRGTVWLDQVYFAIRGLENYGYRKEAVVFTENVFARLEGLKNSGKPIRENYWPLDGKGMRVNHFSWSAAHLLLLYLGK